MQKMRLPQRSVRRRLAVLLTAPLLGLAGSVTAQQPQAQAGQAASPSASYGGLGLSIGTTGLGVDYGFGLSRFVDLRAGYQFGSYSHDWDQDQNTYHGKLKANAAKLMLDVMPFAGGFHVSAGLYSRVPELTLKASDQQRYDYNGTTYNGALKLDGGIDLGKAAPYLGLGWGGTSGGRGFGLRFDMGVLFGKSPDVSLTASGRACDATVDASCDPNGALGFDVNSSDPRAQIFQQNLKDEIAKIEDDARKYRYWPVLNLGLHYRF